MNALGDAIDHFSQPMEHITIQHVGSDNLDKQWVAELQMHNQQLMDEYELKDEETQSLQQWVYELELMLKESEIRLTIANELYQKEKMEKERIANEMNKKKKISKQKKKLVKEAK